MIYPDPGFIVDKKNDLLGIILTHAHEDHIGSIAHIWPKLKCKIFATPFTSVLIKEKFKEQKIDISSYLQIVQLNSQFSLGPFVIDLVTLTHSIVEPNGLSITTPKELSFTLETGKLIGILSLEAILIKKVKRHRKSRSYSYDL